jgi:two-component system response regulator YesN
LYKILIVDDEDIVRNSIASLIDWKSLGFDEVYQAENGMVALDMAVKFKPDVVLTDIRMPFMDGLELSARLREQIPSVNIVILSGHDEFKYAKEAMTYGVLDYLLKPIGPDSLSEKMAEIKDKLDAIKNEQAYLEKMRSQIHQSLPLLTEKFLNSIITNNFVKKTYPNMLEFLAIPLNEGPFLVSVIEPDTSETSENDSELYLFAVQNIAKESLPPSNPIFTDSEGRIVIIFSLDPSFSQEASHESVLELLNIMSTNVNLYLKIKMTASMGSIVSKLGNIYMSYNEALSALECKYTLGKNKIYDINDMNYVESAIVYPHDAFSEFLNAVKSTNQDLIKNASQSITAALKSEQVISIANIKLVFIEIITSLLKLLAITKGTSRSVWTEGLSLFGELDRLDTIDSFAETVTGYALKVSSELSLSRAKGSNSIVSNVVDYLMKNYQQEDISLLSAAKYASVNPSYLSTLFKKETGKNFVDYLNRVRIDKAIDLLRTTDLKAYEIAGLTGFANPHYFSILFKKMIGVSPSEFKSGDHS